MRTFFQTGALLPLLLLSACQPQPPPATSPPLPFPLQVEANKPWSPPITCTGPTNRTLITIEREFQNDAQPKAPQEIEIALGRNPEVFCISGIIKSSHAGTINYNDGSLIGTFQLPAAGPFQTQLLRVSIEVGEPERHHGPSSERYLKGDTLSPVDAPEIQVIAAKIKGATPGQSASNVKSWMKRNIKAEGYSKQRRGALWTLQKGYGDCTDVSALAVSLYRGVGVPARIVEGYVCGEKSRRGGECEEWLPHAWVEWWGGRDWEGVDFTRGDLRARGVGVSN